MFVDDTVIAFEIKWPVALVVKVYGTINYCNTGSGSNTGLASAMTTLSGHSANIPGSATTFQQGWTDFAFYQPGQYHWGLKGGNRWEVDDYANGSQHNTLHRVWVRYAS